MLGALTQDRVTYDEATRLIFPGSVAGSETGGVPGVIETMTLQDLIDFHETYYHPSNSLMMLYGDLDIEPFLELIDGAYLSKYDRAEIDLTDHDYTPLCGDAAETFMYYAVPLPGMSLEELNLFAIAVNTVTQVGQPLDQLLKERLPGASISAMFDFQGPSPSMYLSVAGASAEQKDEVRATIRDDIAATLERGLDPGLLAAAVLSERMRQATLVDSTTAVDIAQMLISYWSMNGDPLAFLEEDHLQQNLQNYLDEGAFDAVLEKYLANPVATGLAVTTGEPGLKEKQDAELAQRLASKKAAMSEEEIAELVAQYEELERWNAENEATLSLAPLQAVDVATLPEEGASFTARDEDVDGLRVVSSEVDSDLMQLQIYLDASGIPAEQLDEAALAMGLLGYLFTENYDEAALNSESAATTGSIATQLAAIRHEDGSYAPCAEISFSCFPEDLDAAFALVEEQLLRTNFDPEEIQTLCGAIAPTQKANIDPYRYASELSEAVFDESKAYDLRLGSFGLFQTMERVSEMEGEELTQFAQGMKDAMELLCNRNGMILTVAGRAENAAAATEQTQRLRALFDGAQHAAVDYSEALALPRNIAVTCNIGVVYNLLALPFEDLGMEFSGKMLAFSSAATGLTLVPVLRDTYRQHRTNRRHVRRCLFRHLHLQIS